MSSSTGTMALYVRVFDGDLGTRTATKEQDNADGTLKDVQQNEEPPDNFASVGSYVDGHYMGDLKELEYICPSNLVPLGLITCKLCKRLLKVPVCLPTCGHQFCRKCIEKEVPKTSGKCPTCESRFTKSHIAPLHGYSEIVRNMRKYRRCVNALGYDKSKKLFCVDPRSCQYTGNGSQLTEHEATCGFKIERCTLGCQSLHREKDREVHKEVCKYECRAWPCRKVVLHKLMEHHKQEECPATILTCPMEEYGCSEKPRRCDLGAHLAKCPYARFKDTLSEQRAEIVRLRGLLQAVKPEMGEEPRVTKRLRSSAAKRES